VRAQLLLLPLSYLLPSNLVRDGVVGVLELLLLPLSYLLFSSLHTIPCGSGWCCRSGLLLPLSDLHLLFSLHTIPCGEGGCCRIVKAVAVASVLSPPLLLPPAASLPISTKEKLFCSRAIKKYFKK
jgi:hypothetical protein